MLEQRPLSHCWLPQLLQNPFRAQEFDAFLYALKGDHQLKEFYKVQSFLASYLLHTN